VAVATQIAIKRAYDEPSEHDGYRVLVDRVWPRGRNKDELRLDAWERDLAPTTALRRWFGHDPVKWPEFRRRYEAELRTEPQRARLAHLMDAAAGHRRLTLVFGARDEEHNQAVVLRDALERYAARRERRPPAPRR
jgi:uncharacterized protein YeaO (DUF488 family)